MVLVADGVNVMVIAGLGVAFAVLVVVLEGSVVFEGVVADRVVVAAVSVVIIGDVAVVVVVELDAVVSVVSGGIVVID